MTNSISIPSKRNHNGTFSEYHQHTFYTICVFSYQHQYVDDRILLTLLAARLSEADLDAEVEYRSMGPEENGSRGRSNPPMYGGGMSMVKPGGGYNGRFNVTRYIQELVHQC